MENKKIAMVVIQEERSLNVIYVKYGSCNQVLRRLYVYHPDDLYVTGMELMDLTEQEALDLLRARDKAYIRS